MSADAQKGRARIVLMPFHKQSRETLDAVAAEAERLIEFNEPDASSYVVEFARRDLKKP